MDRVPNNLQQWLNSQLPGSLFQTQAIPGDASFRRYFRIQLPQTTYIAMDASPEKENCKPFIAIAKALRAMQLHAPEIFASDIQQGFLLLTDFGEDLYLKKLNPENAEILYETALNALAILQTCENVSDWNVPHFTAEFMRQELELFKEWFLQRYLKLTLTPDTEKKLATSFDFLAQRSAQQKQVFMHRDFHSANLMVLPQNQVGILDFQDAFIGPVTYDLASLLRDCYIAWPEMLVKKLVLSYRDKINLISVSENEFLYWFDMMSLQRHLKALLTFSRKFCRDQNANYLQHIPRTLEYLLQVSARYPETKMLHEILNTQVINVCAR